tara:strand:- start:914 stop:1114 length:201 start_codon:yes stop_codon:yes gene_type:complete
MKTLKIAKGYYKVETTRGAVYVAHDKSIEGELKWNVWSDNFELPYMMDSLWYTKKEALKMIEYFLF